MGTGGSKKIHQKNSYRNQNSCGGESYQKVPAERMNKLLHRLIGIILSEDEFGKVGIGTGILISPDLVLTVAHNIYNFDGKKEYHKISFCPGHSGPIGVCSKVQSWYFPEAFKLDNSPKNDIALMRLAKKTEENEFIPLKNDVLGVLQKEKVSVYGYPTKGNKSVQHQLEESQEMANSEEGHDRYRDVTNEKEYRFSIDQMGLTKDHQCITSINSDRREILHKISTEPGHSGAPIILEQEQHTLRIIGVHKGGVKDQELNAGGLITAELINQLKRQAGKLGAESFKINKYEVDFRKAEALRSQGRWGEAKLYYQDVLSSQKRHFQALCGFALVLKHLKQYKDALQKAEWALEIKQDSIRAMIIKGAVLNCLTRHKEAYECYRKLLQLDPQNKQANGNMGYTLNVLGQYPEGSEYLQKALKNNSQNENNSSSVSILNNKGCSLYSQGKEDEAVQCFKKGLVISSDDIELRYNLGCVLRNKKDYTAAIRQYQLVIKSDPIHLLAHNDIGYCLFKMNRFTEAQEKFKEAIRCDGNHQLSYDNYIHTLASHDKAEGLRYLGQLKAKYPEAQKAYEKLSRRKNRKEPNQQD